MNSSASVVSGEWKPNGEGFPVHTDLNNRSTNPIKMPKPTREELQRRNEFEELKCQLRDEKFADQIRMPMAYWTLPSDRGLPFALLDRTVADLLATPYENLAATPGIGTKKLDALLTLLHRVGDGDSGSSTPTSTDGKQSAEPQPTTPSAPFDPHSVSEQEWRGWRDLVNKYKVGNEKLGRVAPSLRQLPSVLWHKPLSTFVELTLQDIRQLKSFGEKRVAALLTVFHSVRGILSAFESQDILPSRLLPKNVFSVEAWINHLAPSDPSPTWDELREHVLLPLVDQIQIDATPTHHKLLQSRLGLAGPKTSIREQARQLGLARARIYQLLEDCSNIFAVRWPEAAANLERLAELYSESPADDERFAAIAAIQELVG